MSNSFLDIPEFTPVMQPSSGLISNPGIKEVRVDFNDKSFDLLIETKGQRLAWSRATECPCSSVNDQTQLPDPNCPLCKGSGWFYFSPNVSVTAEKVGKLSEVQKAILERNSAGIIKGVITGVKSIRYPYNALGNWQEGDIQVSVRPPNKLGHYDKLVNLDSEIVYVEAVVSNGQALPLTTRYLVNQINFIRSFATEYKVESDYILDEGRIYWMPGKAPSAGTRLSIHYLTNPTWLVIDHPHAIRASLQSLKIKNKLTPQGNPQDLPIQAHCRLEFLVLDQ